MPPYQEMSRCRQIKKGIAALRSQREGYGTVLKVRQRETLALPSELRKGLSTYSTSSARLRSHAASVFPSIQPIDHHGWRRSKIKGKKAQNPRQPLCSSEGMLMPCISPLKATILNLGDTLNLDNSSGSRQTTSLDTSSRWWVCG
jgi:hypothetical protein